MSRFIRPISDLNVGSWTVAPLFSKIDEVTPNDSDFVSAPDSQGAIVGLGSIDVDVADTLTIRIRARNTDHDTTPRRLVVALQEGATDVAYDAFNLSSVFQTFEFVIPRAKALTITDWSNLRLFFYFLASDTQSVYVGTVDTYIGNTSIYVGQEP
ncbi:MAG: hypothetical protein LC687_02025 [Actinobacteria bacterium]|nr:hypothetical protein [Actinomycetota bacterium]